MSNYNTVQDINDNDSFALVSNSQDIKAVLEYIGKDDLIDEVGCLFVEMLDGDYGDVYYCKSNIPYLSYNIYKIRGGY